MPQHEQQWDAMTDEQRVAFLATEVMGWHEERHKYGAVLWCDSEGRTQETKIPEPGMHADFDYWNPLTDWNSWRSVEFKVMEDRNLWDKFAQEVWEHGNCKFGGDMMKTDLPTRARSLYLAYSSLPPIQ